MISSSLPSVYDGEIVLFLSLCFMSVLHYLFSKDSVF